jgi:hypothetical protein
LFGFWSSTIASHGVERVMGEAAVLRGGQRQRRDVGAPLPLVERPAGPGERLVALVDRRQPHEAGREPREPDHSGERAVGPRLRQDASLRPPLPRAIQSLVHRVLELRDDGLGIRPIAAVRELPLRGADARIAVGSVVERRPRLGLRGRQVAQGLGSGERKATEQGSGGTNLVERLDERLAKRGDDPFLVGDRLNEPRGRPIECQAQHVGLDLEADPLALGFCDLVTGGDQGGRRDDVAGARFRGVQESIDDRPARLLHVGAGEVGRPLPKGPLDRLARPCGRQDGLGEAVVPAADAVEQRGRVDRRRIMHLGSLLRSFRGAGDGQRRG